MGGAPSLVTLPDGGTFQVDAAASVLRMEAELGWLIPWNSTYRDWAKQLAMYEAWNRYVASGYKPALYPGHSRALHPDESEHCKGLAGDTSRWAEIRLIANRHGWFWVDDPTEKHHLEYRIQHDQYRHEGIPAGQKEDDMVNVSDADLKLLLDGARASIGTREITGGSLKNEDRVLPLLRRAVAAAEATVPPAVGTRQILGGSVADRDGDGKQDEPGVIPRLRTILALLEQMAKQSGITFDYEAFAAELAPYLELATLSDGDLQAIAKAAADEQDRRDREWLGA